jgi:hypothetical protein
VNATETKLKTTSSSSRSSPGISRPTFPPIQPDGVGVDTQTVPRSAWAHDENPSAPAPLVIHHAAHIAGYRANGPRSAERTDRDGYECVIAMIVRALTTNLGTAKQISSCVNIGLKSAAHADHRHGAGRSPSR